MTASLETWHHDLWHNFSTLCDTTNNCLTPCDKHLQRHLYGGYDQFISSTPVTLYFWTFLTLWTCPCDRGWRPICLGHLGLFYPLRTPVTDHFLLIFTLCDKYVVTTWTTIKWESPLLRVNFRPHNAIFIYFCLFSLCNGPIFFDPILSLTKTAYKVFSKFHKLLYNLFLISKFSRHL